MDSDSPHGSLRALSVGAPVSPIDQRAFGALPSGGGGAAGVSGTGTAFAPANSLTASGGAAASTQSPGPRSRAMQLSQLRLGALGLGQGSQQLRESLAPRQLRPPASSLQSQQPVRANHTLNLGLPEMRAASDLDANAEEVSPRQQFG